MSVHRPPGAGATPPTTQQGTSRPAPAQLTTEQVVALCYAMTGDRTRVANAAAILLAESGGNTAARCYNHRAADGTVYCGAPGAGVISTDRGLAQFNSVSHAELTDAECDDPKRAVSAFFHLSHGFVDFHEWATYSSGAYRRYLPATQETFDAITAKGPSALTQILAKIGGGFVAGGKAAGDVAGGVAHATVSLGEFLGHLSDPTTWHRVVYVVLGLAAVLLGAFLLDRSLLNQIAGSAVTSAAGAVAARVAS